jgi:hypothetical protein
MSKLK